MVSFFGLHTTRTLQYNYVKHYWENTSSYIKEEKLNNIFPIGTVTNYYSNKLFTNKQIEPRITRLHTARTHMHW